MTSCTVQYKRKLKENLRCSCSAKRKLLDRFDDSLREYLDENPSPTMEELSTAFGPPEEMARTLMENVDEADKAAYSKFLVARRVTAGILAAVLLAFSAYVFFLKEIPMTVIINGEIADSFNIPEEQMTAPVEGEQP